MSLDDEFSRQKLVNAPPVGAVYSHIIRFQDVDAAGIVFYPRILEYFHDSFVVFLRAAGHAMEQGMAEESWTAPIHRIDATFLRPLHFGDPADTAVVKVALEGTNLWLGFRTSVRGDAAAVGIARHVFLDRKTFKRREPPDPLRAFYEGIADPKSGTGST